MESFNSSNLIRVDRHRLLATLESNRAKHSREYQKAIAQFRKDVIEELRKMADVAEQGGPVTIMTRENNICPQDHTEDYNRAIARYEFSVDDNIVLTEVQFNSYVLNEWQWTGNISNSFYATKSI